MPCFGALDLGTNNCRLLIVRPEGTGHRVVDSFSRIVRLGEGCSASNRVSEKAVRRTIGALKVFANKLHGHHVTKFRCVATEACRRATNGAKFVTRVRKATGLPLEIISPEEEVALTFAGCAELIVPGDGWALVFDIGGGSTEVTWARLDGEGNHRIEGFLSLPVGVVTLAEERGAAGFGHEAYAGMVEELALRFCSFDAAHGIARRIAEGGVQMLGTSGTTTTLAGILLDLKRYDRSRVDGSYLERERVHGLHGLAAQLLDTTLEERMANPCIGRGRADLVIPGCAILEAIWRTWPAPRLRVADRGIREGILKSLIGTWPLPVLAS